MKKNLLSILLLIFLSSAIFAQNRTVTGRVTSADDSLGLPGVSVIVKGTSRGASADMDGKYIVTGLLDTDVLVFSFIGFRKQEIAIGTKKEINVVLEIDANDLEEVVVTALGVKRQKREIGYSTDKINNEDLVRSNSSNVINAIVGRSAGVQVSQGNGVEGGTTRITIRGNNNLDGNNQPLIVVDNVPLDNPESSVGIGRGVDWGNPIADIDPQDIETYTVLKGGAASALYGSRGANGVILITTKRGKKNEGIGVSYNFSHKIIHPYKYRDVQNTYGAGGPISLTPASFPMNGDTLLYPGIYGTDNLIINQDGESSSSAAEFGYYGTSVSWGPKMEGQMIKWWDGEMRAYSPQPDNLKSVYQNGSTQTHNISASGGSEKGTVRVSITRQDHKAMIDNSNFDRTTISMGANMKVSKKVMADISMSYVKYNRLNSPILGDDHNSFSKGYLYSWARSYQAVDKQNYMNPDGTRNEQEGFPFMFVSPHLWWNYYKNNTQLTRDKYFGAISLSYDITSWIKLLARAGSDFSLEQFTTKKSPTDFIGLKDGYYSSTMKKTQSNTYEMFLTAEKKIGSKFNVKFTAGMSRWDYNLYGIGGRSGTWYYPNMYYFNNFTQTTYTQNELGQTIVDHNGDNLQRVVASEQVVKERNNSVYSFLNLSYDNYLFLELTGRNDWSSTLPPENNSYFYPSVSLSFIPTDAFHLERYTPWMNFMKIRGGIAQTATDATPYRRHFYYNAGLFGGQQTTQFPNTIPPFSLKPQRVNAYEIGLNMSFLQNKITFDFTYYYLYSFDQYIPQLPLPVSSGAPFITTNDGIVTNKGIEFTIDAVPIQTNQFLFKTGVNFSRNTNTVVDLGGYAEVLELANIWGLNGPSMVLHEGDEYGTIYGYDHLYDDNGRPIVNDEGTKYLITDNRVPIGNASPDFLAGWFTEFHYKGFTLSTLIDTKWGGDIYSGSYVINLQTGQSPETLIEREGGGLPYTDPDGTTSNIGIVLDGVHEDGTENNTVVHYYYKYLPNAGGWGKFISTPGVVENTWVKMREIALVYNLPHNLLRKTKVFQKLSISLVGRDLFYIYTTLPDNINPEGIMGSGNAQGFEWASMPSSQSFTIGISATF